MFVHVGGACDSIFLSDMNKLEEFSFITYIDFSDILNIRAKFVLSNFKVIFCNIKQISDFFHIELKY